MKATRTNFDDMWEQYFDNYQGWLYVADCLFPSRQLQKPVENTTVKEECNISYTLSDSEDNQSDKLYPVDKDDYYLSDIQSETYSDNDETKNPDEIKNKIHDKEKSNYGLIEETKGDVNLVKKVKDYRPEIIVGYSKLSKQPDDIIFECDTGSGFAFVTQKEDTLIYTPPRNCVSKTLATISIDTTNLKKPKTKVLFSCNICFIPRTDKGTSQLEFILSRSCNNSAESPIGNWIYDLVDKSERISQTFKFNYCSCSSFPGIYNYYIRVIPVYIRNCSVLITYCHIDAFAQSK